MPRSMGHAVERIRDRYGLEVDEEDLVTVCAGIAGKWTGFRYLKPGHRGQEEWIVPLYDAEVRVVWDRVNERIVTALPPWLEKPPRDEGRSDNPYRRRIKRALVERVEKRERRAVERQLRE